MGLEQRLRSWCHLRRSCHGTLHLSWLRCNNLHAGEIGRSHAQQPSTSRCLHLALFLPDRGHDLFSLDRLQGLAKARSDQQTRLVHRLSLTWNWLRSSHLGCPLLHAIRLLQGHQERSKLEAVAHLSGPSALQTTCASQRRKGQGSQLCRPPAR